MKPEMSILKTSMFMFISDNLLMHFCDYFNAKVFGWIIN